MKDRMKTIVSILVLAFFSVFGSVGIVIAHEGEDHTVAQNTTAAQEDNETTDLAELKSRLAERKASLKTRITAAKLSRVKSKCKASQGNISKISGRIKGLETSRTQVYKNLINRLTKLGELLKTKGIDTAELDAEITELKTKVDTFNTDLAAYKQAVADLAEMDCVSDPTAFQASLEAAREARAKTAEDAKAIRTYLSDTVKPTLKELKAQLADSAETKPETEDGGNN